MMSRIDPLKSIGTRENPCGAILNDDSMPIEGQARLQVQIHRRDVCRRKPQAL